MSMSDYLEQAILRHVLKDTAFAVPTNIYVGVSTADPGEAAGGLAEPVGNAYARVQMNNWTWNSGAAREENNAAITFPTATGSWGTITHIAFFDAATGGNFLGSSALLSAKTINNGDTISFPIGQVQWSLD